MQKVRKNHDFARNLIVGVRYFWATQASADAAPDGASDGAGATYSCDVRETERSHWSTREYAAFSLVEGFELTQVRAGPARRAGRGPPVC